MKSITNYINESNNDSFTFDKTNKQTVSVEYKYKYNITVNDYFWESDDTGEKYDLTKEDPNTIYQEHPTGYLSVDLNVDLDIVPSAEVEESDENDMFNEFFTSDEWDDHKNGWFEIEYDGNSNKIKGDLPYSEFINWEEILENFASYYQDEFIQEYLDDIISKC